MDMLISWFQFSSVNHVFASFKHEPKRFAAIFHLDHHRSHVVFVCFIFWALSNPNACFARRKRVNFNRLVRVNFRVSIHTFRRFCCQRWNEEAAMESLNGKMFKENRVSTMSCLYYLNISFPVRLLGLATFKSYETKSNRKKTTTLFFCLCSVNNESDSMLEEWILRYTCNRNEPRRLP